MLRKFWTNPDTGEEVWATEQKNQIAGARAEAGAEAGAGAGAEAGAEVNLKSPHDYHTLVDFFYFMRPSQSATVKDMYDIMLAEMFLQSIFSFSSAIQNANQEAGFHLFTRFPELLNISRNDGLVSLSFTMRQVDINTDTGEDIHMIDFDFKLTVPTLTEERAGEDAGAVAGEVSPTSKETIARLLEIIKDRRGDHPISLRIKALRELKIGVTVLAPLPPMGIIMREYYKMDGWIVAAQREEGEEMIT